MELKRGHKVWDAMSHRRRVNAVATVVAYDNRRDILHLLNEPYMGLWVTQFLGEVVAKARKMREQ